MKLQFVYHDNIHDQLNLTRIAYPIVLNKKLDYFFDRVDVVLGVSGDDFKVFSKFILPQTLGDSFVLSADLRGLHKGFKNIKGKLYSKGENINLELLDDFFPK